jgi:hypothetical protein
MLDHATNPTIIEKDTQQVNQAEKKTWLHVYQQFMDQ